MEEYQCSSAASAPLIHSSGKDGDTSGKKPPLPSSSAEDIWADFDCVIELGHQARREDRMRELNRAYLARGPSPIDEDGFKSEINIVDKEKVPEGEANATGDGNTCGNIPLDLQLRQAMKQEQIATKPEKETATRANLEVQNEEFPSILKEDLQIIKENRANEGDTESDYNDSTFASEMDDLPIENASSFEEKLLSEYKDVMRKPSALKLRSRMFLEYQENYRSKEDLQHELLDSETDSRIKVPMNTPVPSFISGYSPRESHSMGISANSDWYARSIEQIRRVDTVDDDPNEELERMFKQSLGDDQFCTEQKKLSSRRNRQALGVSTYQGLLEKESSFPRYASLDLSRSSSTESEDDSSRLIRKLTKESSGEDIPAFTSNAKRHLTKRKTVESAVSSHRRRILGSQDGKDGRAESVQMSHHKNDIGAYSYQTDLTDMVSVETCDGNVPCQDVIIKPKKGFKPNSNAIVVKPISGCHDENKPHHGSQSDDASSVNSQSDNCDVTDYRKEKYKLRQRIGHAMRKAAGKLRAAFRMCRVCCR